MEEWHYQRLKALPETLPTPFLGKPREKNPFVTDRDLLQKGWIEIVEVEHFDHHWTKTSLGKGPVSVRTPEGTRALVEAEAAWKKWRLDDPEWGPAEFWTVETSRGLCHVRVPKNCGEIAEQVAREAFGSLENIRLVRRFEDHLNAHLDGMSPEGLPCWRSFTGRPLRRDAGEELRISMGLPPEEG